MQERYLCRAKRIDNGEWECGCLIVSNDQDYRIATSLLESADEPLYVVAYSVDLDTVCACVGFDDKNGNLIFEGDIVRHYNNPSYPELYDVGLILYQEDNAGFERTSRMHDDNVGINVNCIYEVIGNKFDNPELLEV